MRYVKEILRSALAYDTKGIINLVTRYFHSGDSDLLVGLFADRFPVFTETRVSLTATRADTKVKVEPLIAAARQRGMICLESRIISVEPSPKGDSSIVRVEWNYIGTNDQPAATGDVKYYCGKDSVGVVRILMIEYMKTPCPNALSEMSRTPRSRTLN